MSAHLVENVPKLRQIHFFHQHQSVEKKTHRGRFKLTQQTNKEAARRSRSSLPDVVVGIVVVAVEDGGGQADELHLLPPGLVVVEGVELHGGLHHQLGLLVALHVTQRQHAAHQQLPPVLLGQDVGFTWTETRTHRQSCISVLMTDE